MTNHEFLLKRLSNMHTMSILLSSYIIDDESAKLYLHLVEAYMNAHSELVIEFKREENGYMRYSIEKRFKED